MNLVIFLLILVILKISLSKRKYRKFGYTNSQIFTENMNKINKKTALYIIYNQEAYKVGISNNPNKRFQSLQTASEKPLEVIEIKWFATRKEALKEERRIHKLLKKNGHWIRGEWFSDLPAELFPN